jgi:sugar transferase (PEP-CTERM system associated)
MFNQMLLNFSCLTLAANNKPECREGCSKVRPMRRQIHVERVGIAVLESALFIVAPYLAAYIRFEHGISEAQHQLGPLWIRGLYFSASMFLGLLATGLYSFRQRATPTGIAARLALVACQSFVALAMVSYVLPAWLIGRGLLALTVLIGFVTCVVIRVGATKLLGEEHFKRRVLVIGAGRCARVGLSRLRRRTDRRGFTIIGFVATAGDDLSQPPPGDIVQVTRHLRSYSDKNEIDEIVVAMDDRRGAFPTRELLECRLSGIEVIDLQTFLERETGKVRLEVLNPSWLIFGAGYHRTFVRESMVRLFDIAAAAALLVVFSPVMLLAALAIKFEDGIRAPVLYRQLRVGLEGRTFEMIKFRSMRIDAEPDGKALWASKNDNRVTRIGSIIRKTRIDELPQIFNVLVGHMSLVGPRPERPEFVGELRNLIPYYAERHFVKPGITGWAQLCYRYGSSAEDAAEKLQYDLYYVKNRSVLFDLSILIQTAEVILWGKGAR